MAGKRTLKQQLFNAIDSRHRVGKGRSKHQDKRNGDVRHDIIYSRSEWDRLKDVGSNFCNFVREKYPEMWRSQVSELKVELLNEYLETKAYCSQNTINSYGDSLKKIFRCAQATYKTSDFREMEYIKKPISERSEESILRDIAFSRDVHNAALDKMDKNSGGYRGNLINSIIGSRSDETVHIRAKDFDFNKNTIHIYIGKNGKPRTVKVSQENMNLIRKEIFKDGNKEFKPNQPVCGCGVDSIQKGLTRALERVDKERGTNFAEQLKDKKTNQHAGRKMVATEQYNKNVNNSKYELIYRKLIKEHREGKIDLSGLNKYEIGARAKYILKNYEHNYINKIELLEIEDRAWSKVSLYLGHGEDRPELKSVYVITDNTKILSFT